MNTRKHKLKVNVNDKLNLVLQGQVKRAVLEYMIKMNKETADVVPNKKLTNTLMPYLADAHEPWDEVKDQIEWQNSKAQKSMLQLLTNMFRGKAPWLNAKLRIERGESVSNFDQEMDDVSDIDAATVIDPDEYAKKTPSFAGNMTPLCQQPEEQPE